MEEINIIVVEDEIIVAEDIKRSLQNMGYTVSAIVSSGEDAIIKAGELMPDMILMDIVLRGEMNGIEAAGRIRSDLKIPVIYLTAYTDEKILEQAKLTEPFGYIIKPFEDKELHSVIEMALYKNRMDNKLRESQDWLSTVLHSIGDGVIATDKDGNVIFINPVAEKLTGWDQDDAKGRDLEEVFNIINEETEEKAENPAKKVIKEGMVLSIANHTILISKDNNKIAIDDSAAPIINAKKEITGVVLVFHDITERRKMEKELNEKLQELGNFYKLAVNRELRMKELKVEIEKLKSN
jgi:PAS domain S-box-containing protein